ncbi:MAG: hypothetical protein QOD74_2209 [Variibacter sp.]|nr:hypothetical protein [Variibacter sp.]
MYRDKVGATQKDAQSLAVEALSFLAEEPDRFGRFLALTGISPQHLRQTAADPAFLSAVLDHVTGEAALLGPFAMRVERTPAAIERARRILSGPEWEADTA